MLYVGLRPTSGAQNITMFCDMTHDITLTKFLFSLQFFFFFLLTTVTKKKPARKADGRTFEYKKSSSLGSCNRIGDAGGGDEARGCEGLNSDAGDSSTEDVESV